MVDQPRMPRRGDPRLEDRLDQWMSAGRQLVDGVSGARPGSRPGARGATGRAAGRPSLDGLGRWVENKLDWLLEEEDDWREPWEQPALRRPEPPAPQVAPEMPRSQGRRPLEAISRRVAPPAAAGDWPEDEAFSVSRWQRQPAAPSPLVDQPSSGGRAVPRSSRRRFD